MKYYIMFLLLHAALLFMGLGFVIGKNSQKKLDLEHCKQAGWEFIDSRIQIVGVDNHESAKIYMSLHSAVATECIVRIDD